MLLEIGKEKVILYGDKITEAMTCLIETTKERRKVQKQFNEEHGITPKTIYKTQDDIMFATTVADSQKELEINKDDYFDYSRINDTDRHAILETLKKAMIDSAESLEFEKAARIRDEITEIEAGIK